MNTEAVRMIPLTSDLNMNIIFAKMVLKIISAACKKLENDSGQEFWQDCCISQTYCTKLWLTIKICYSNMTQNQVIGVFSIKSPISKIQKSTSSNTEYQYQDDLLF
jgi:hypothetical protein